MKKQKWVMLLSCLAMCLSAYDLKNPALTPVQFKTPVQHDPVELIKNGEVRFAVIADLDRERGGMRGRSLALAVNELKLSIRKCTGKDLEVFRSSEIEQAKKKYPFVMILGDNALSRKYVDVSKFQPEQFEVVTIPDGVVIAGTDSSVDPEFNKDPLDRKGDVRGTLYGTYDFMERVMDIRYYMPGTGCLYPEIKDLSLSPFRYTDYSRYRVRNGIYFINMTMSKLTKNSYRRSGYVDEWKVFLGDELSPESADQINDRWRMASLEPPFGGHDPDDKKLQKAYPDKLKTIFYESPNGNYYYAPNEIVGSYYDAVHLEFADLLVESLKKYFASHGKENDGWSWANNTYITFGVTDHRMTVADIEIDPLVKKLNLITEADKKRGAPLANLYGRFIQYLDQRIQKELPGKKLCVMAYYDIQKASLDPRWKLSKNVVVSYCDGSFPGMVWNKKVRAAAEQDMAEWQQVTGNPVMRIYGYNHNTNVYARAMSPEMMGPALKKWGQGPGYDGCFLDACAFFDFWNHFYSKYVTYRMMWNPDFDGDAAVAEMFERLYGKKAGAYLTEFHSLLKKTYIELTSVGDDMDILPSLKTVDQLESLLKKAEESLPAGDERAKKHFQLLAQRWPDAFTSTRNRHSFERVVYNIHQLSGNEQVTVDGLADESFWKNVEPMKIICPLGSGKTFKSPPDIRLAWDKNGIYGLVTLPYLPEVNKPGIWSNDSVEIFLAPGVKQQEYYHIVLDPYGHHIEKMKKLAPVVQPYGRWTATGFKFKTNILKKEWMIEFFVPFSSMDKDAPQPYDSWLANITHMKKTTPEEYSGTTQTLGNNHNLPQYSIIRFNGKGE